jgi:hypothetical protein
VVQIGLWLLSGAAVGQQQPMFLLNIYQLCMFILLVAAKIHLVALVDSCLAVGCITDEMVEFSLCGVVFPFNLLVVGVVTTLAGGCSKHLLWEMYF